MANMLFVALLIAAVAMPTINGLSCYRCLYIEGSSEGYPSVEDCRENPPSKYIESLPGSKLLSSKPLSNLPPHVQMAFAPSTPMEKLVCVTNFLDISVPAMPGLGAVDGKVIERSFVSVPTSFADGCHAPDLDKLDPLDGIQIRSFDQCVCSSDACNNIGAPY